MSTDLIITTKIRAGLNVSKRHNFLLHSDHSVCTMTRPIDERERNKIIELYGAGFSNSAIASSISVSRKTVKKYIDRYVETGRVYIKKQTRRSEKLSQRQSETLRDSA